MIKEVKQINTKEAGCGHTQFNDSGEGGVRNRDMIRGRGNITAALNGGL